MRKIAVISLKLLASLLLVVFLAVFVTSVSPIYRFAEARPFSGPDIFNPYRHYVDSLGWKRANFHTHTKVKSLLNECDYWPAEVLDAYEKFDYDIITFYNHNRLTEYPGNSELQVNVYEHGYNFFKFHKLVFGSRTVNRFDALLPVLPSQCQFQIDWLSRGADFIQLNHPFRTNCMTEDKMRKLEGYRITELDSGVTTGQEYWDWSLSSGHYSFALANDDLHYPDRSDRIAVRCNYLNCPSGRYEDLKACLLDGCYWSMRVPDFGNGDWESKYRGNAGLPTVTRIGLDSATVFIGLSCRADSIVVNGMGHSTLLALRDTSCLEYEMKPEDSYARVTAFFSDGTVIYSNAFARYDASMSDSPYREPSHSVNWPLTLLYNLVVLSLAALTIWLLLSLRRNSSRRNSSR